MKKCQLLLLYFIAMNTYGQSNAKLGDASLRQLVHLLHQLNKTREVNQFRHVNQEVAYKQGLWIESDRSSLWLFNYNNGVKEGAFYNYDLSTGEKAMEGQYKNGKLTGVVTIFNADGNVSALYKNIRVKPNRLNLTIEAATGKGDDFTFKKENVAFAYEADFEKYTREGKVYKTGKGAFNDFKTYDIVNNKGFSEELSLFRIYEIPK
jgi:hypothetical protein